MRKINSNAPGNYPAAWTDNLAGLLSARPELAGIGLAPAVVMQQSA